MALRVDDSDVDRQPWPQSSATFQPPPRLATRLVRWLVVILIVAAAAYAAWGLIVDETNACAGQRCNGTVGNQFPFG